MMISDIQGILGLKAKQFKSNEKQTNKASTHKKTEKRRKTAEDVAKQLLPDSMGIQLDGIISQIQDSSQHNVNTLALSIKKFGKKPVRKWKRVAFENPARTDGLRLYHYQREDTKEDEAYAFASLNKKYSMPKYSKELYNAAFVDDDWTKAETDYMMDLVDEYSLIWEVVADRYNYRGKKRGSLDIQKRFYQIEDYIKALNDEPTSGFDYDAEKCRREKLANYLNYTSEELEFEDKIIKEYERIKKMDTELTIRKRREDLERYTKTHRPGTFSMMTATKMQQKNTQKRSFLSPLSSPLKSPTENQSLNIEDIRDFGLTAKPSYTGNEFNTGAQNAGEIYLSGPIHKMKFYLSVNEFYETSKCFSYENVQNTFKIRKYLNCISEQKASLMLLMMEMEHLMQQLKAKNINVKKLPEKCTIDYFMKSRPSHNKKESFASLFSIIPAVFPPSDPIDRSNKNEIKRKKNLPLMVPDGIVPPEGITSRMTFSPSPIRQIPSSSSTSSTTNNNRKRQRKLSNDEATQTINKKDDLMDPAKILANRQQNSPSNLRKNRRTTITDYYSAVQTPTSSESPSTRSRRSLTKKSYIA